MISRRGADSPSWIFLFFRALNDVESKKRLFIVKITRNNDRVEKSGLVADSGIQNQIVISRNFDDE